MPAQLDIECYNPKCANKEKLFRQYTPDISDADLLSHAEDIRKFIEADLDNNCPLCGEMGELQNYPFRTLKIKLMKWEGEIILERDFVYGQEPFVPQHVNWMIETAGKVAEEMGATYTSVEDMG